ncbi:hypothetical protein MMC21_002607 [Puttea exsequens]|nr:hypothetical protein [Puttea exsequens]
MAPSSNKVDSKGTRRKDNGPQVAILRKQLKELEQKEKNEDRKRREEEIEKEIAELDRGDDNPTPTDANMEAEGESSQQNNIKQEDERELHNTNETHGGVNAPSDPNNTKKSGGEVSESSKTQTGGGESSQSNKTQTSEKDVSKSDEQQKDEKKSSKSKGKNVVRIKGNDSSNPITDEDMDLLRPESHQPISGLKDAQKYRHVEIVKGGRGNQILGIVRYGPTNAPIYRREDLTGARIDGVKDITDPKDRPGENYQYENDRKVWKLSRQNLVSIQGVAFPQEKKLKRLNPSWKGRIVWMPTDVLIKWSLDGEVHKSWETRTVFRRLWGKQGRGPDWAIYEAAKYAERRFASWRKGERRTQSRSATPYMPDSDDESGSDNDQDDGSEGEDSEDDDGDRRSKSRKRRVGKSKEVYRARVHGTGSDDSDESSEDDSSRHRSRKGKERNIRLDPRRQTDGLKGVM